MPPHIAGRAREQAAIRESLESLAESRGPGPILMIGPRGCGKTVLIEWCAEQAKKTSRKIRVKELIGDISGDSRKIAQSLIGGGFRPAEATAKLNVGTASADMRFSSDDASRRSDVVEKLVGECRKSPLLLLVDEAARKSPAGMGELLELIQVVNRRSNSLLLVIAGTPGAVEVLRASGATFFDRAKGLNIGLLSVEESKDAIIEPLAELGMSIKDSALADVIEESQGFPFFMQEWGKALFDAATRDGRQVVLADDVDATSNEVRHSREQIYESRYDEWRQADIDLLAKVLRSTQESRESSDFTKADLPGAVSKAMRELDDSDDGADGFSQQILDTGCLWKPLGSPNLVSGLPSFIDHVLRRGQSRPNANQQH